jgi:hypothetical protein
VGGYKILGAGGYGDRFVKTAAGWRIAYRKLGTDRLVDDPEKAVNLADPDVAALVQHLLQSARTLGEKVHEG